MKTKAYPCGLLLALLVLSPSAYAQNLLLNGGFELGLTTPGNWSPFLSAYGAWTVPPGSSAVMLGMPYFSFPPYEGNETMVLGYDGASVSGSISQSFATTAGTQYRVSSAVFGWDGAKGTVRATISSGGYTTHTGNFVSPGGGVWGTNSLTFIGTGPLTTLLLQNVSGGSIIDDVRVVATPPAEFTVFGNGERTQLTNSVTSDPLTLDRASVLPENFNYVNQTTHSVSIIGSRTIIIEQGNALFQAYFNGRTDIKEMELMAETLIIRNPLILKGTRVKISARELRFEGTGQIVTTPANQPLPGAASPGPGLPAGFCEAGLSAGSVDVFVGTFTDLSSANPKFDLTGGRGQAAGQGVHGSDGENLVDYWGCGTTFTYGNASYAPPCGWYVTRQRFSNGSIGNGVERWPGQGGNAWPAGIPGNSGSAGTLTTSHAGVSGVYGAGQPGNTGAPAGRGGHQSTTTCEGGYAGWPNQSIHIYNWDSGVFNQNNHISEDGRSTTTNGASYGVANATAGAAGTRVVSGSSYSWLSPQLLRKLINDTRDDYLQNRIAMAESRFKDYAQVLEQYKANSAAWNAASQITQFELNQMYNEIRLLLQQIANGLDYFGNPNGWVPMLSFEVNANLFDQEISRSLDMIYLARWITQKQANATDTFNALGTVRAKLADEVTDAQGKYTTAAAALAGLQSDAQALSQRVQNLEIQLETKDNQLHQQAIQNTRPPEWETGLRLGLKVAGTMCKMVPVYQPALGAAGDALTLGSDFDPNQPWATINGALDLTTSYLGSGIKDATDAQLLQLLSANLNAAQLKEVNQGSARIAKLQALNQASSSLSAGIKDVSSFLEKSRAPSPDMEAELDRLRSLDPQFTNMVRDLRQLMPDKREFADKIIAGVQDVANLSDLITRNILAMDALSATIAANAAIVDSKVNAYLKDLERRAFDRLLKYHYYMAKAYEYRLVKPYSAQLNLESLFNRIAAIATASTNQASNGVLDSNQQTLLKSLFRDAVAATTQSIITDYNQSPSTPGSSFTFDLTADEITGLNRGEAITLNLVNRGFFLPNEENVRIVDLRVYNNAPSGIGTSGNYGSPAYVDLCTEHSGLSDVKLDGQVYQFRHYNQSTRSAITWKSRYEPGPNILSPTPLIPASDSLLRSLLPSLNTADVLLYSRPSAWADLKIWRAGNNGGTTFGLGTTNAPITLTKVTLQVFYDRTFRAVSPVRKNLEILAAQIVDSRSTNAVVDDNFLPYFSVSRSDPNSRQDARGRVLRIYTSSSSNVQVTAQDPYGSLGFYKWTDNGTDMGANRTITIVPMSDHKVVAQYVSLLPIPLTVINAAGQKTLSWQGGVGVRLQTRSCLLNGCPWQDVSGTDGQSSYIVPPGAGPSYFRLIRVR